MTDESNIYRICRKFSGMTQERFAEAIGVSVEAVAQYERGIIMPADEIVLRMVEVTSFHILGYQHLLNKSRVAKEYLPRVPHVPLTEAVCNLIRELNDFRSTCALDDLVSMAADGRIDAQEQAVFTCVLGQLDGIIRAANMVKYAYDRD